MEHVPTWSALALNNDTGQSRCCRKRLGHREMHRKKAGKERSLRVLFTFCVSLSEAPESLVQSCFRVSIAF